jgi:hypothetical protein
LQKNKQAVVNKPDTAPRASKATNPKQGPSSGPKSSSKETKGEATSSSATSNAHPSNNPSSTSSNPTPSHPVRVSKSAPAQGVAAPVATGGDSGNKKQGSAHRSIQIEKPSSHSSSASTSVAPASSSASTTGKKQLQWGPHGSLQGALSSKEEEKANILLAVEKSKLAAEFLQSAAVASASSQKQSAGAATATTTTVRRQGQAPSSIESVAFSTNAPNPEADEVLPTSTSRRTGATDAVPASKSAKAWGHAGSLQNALKKEAVVIAAPPTAAAPHVIVVPVRSHASDASNDGKASGAAVVREKKVIDVVTAKNGAVSHHHSASNSAVVASSSSTSSILAHDSTVTESNEVSVHTKDGDVQISENTVVLSNLIEEREKASASGFGHVSAASLKDKRETVVISSTTVQAHPAKSGTVNLGRFTDALGSQGDAFVFGFDAASAAASAANPPPSVNASAAAVDVREFENAAYAAAAAAAASNANAASSNAAAQKQQQHFAGKSGGETLLPSSSAGASQSLQGSVAVSSAPMQQASAGVNYSSQFHPQVQQPLSAVPNQYLTPQQQQQQQQHLLSQHLYSNPQMYMQLLQMAHNLGLGGNMDMNSFYNASMPYNAQMNQPVPNLSQTPGYGMVDQSGMQASSIPSNAYNQLASGNVSNLPNDYAALYNFTQQQQAAQQQQQQQVAQQQQYGLAGASNPGAYNMGQQQQPTPSQPMMMMQPQQANAPVYDFSNWQQLPGLQQQNQQMPAYVGGYPSNTANSMRPNSFQGQAGPSSQAGGNVTVGSQPGGGFPGAYPNVSGYPLMADPGHYVSGADQQQLLNPYALSQQQAQVQQQQVAQQVQQQVQQVQQQPKTGNWMQHQQPTSTQPQWGTYARKN